MSDTSLVQVMIDMQKKKPGMWDGRLRNGQGECYCEARHGVNPLEQGFSICAPASPLQRSGESSRSARMNE